VQYSYGNANLIEILWTLCALPGLLLWSSNLRDAIHDRRAVRKLGIIDERLSWANFAILKNSAFLTIEAGFTMVGLTAMLQPPLVKGPIPLTPTQDVLTVCLLGTSALMTFVGIRWRQVSQHILGAARVRAAAAAENASGKDR
jgi:hypothetical protein